MRLCPGRFRSAGLCQTGAAGPKSVAGLNSDGQIQGATLKLHPKFIHAAADRQKMEKNRADRAGTACQKFWAISSNVFSTTDINHQKHAKIRRNKYLNMIQMIRKLPAILIFLTLPVLLFSQRELKAVKDEASSILEEISGSTNKLERVTLVSEDERSVTISATFKGFADKSYKVRGFIQNARKETIQEISPAERDLPKNNQVELTFLMSDNGREVTQTSLESRYLKLTITPNEGGLGSLLEEALGEGISLSSTDYLYELDKKWMFSGQNIILNVKLAPFKNAASISQN